MTILALALAAGLAAEPVEKQLNALAAEAFARRIKAIDGLGREQLAARQRDVRAKILASIGGLPAEKPALNVRVTGGFTRDGYRVENVIFDSLPGFPVTANVYVPLAGKAPYPAVLGVAGHSVNGKASATYQHAWIGFVRRGYVVLAFDPPGQGERSANFDEHTGTSRIGIGVAEHIMEGTQCLLTGHAFARYEIWDGIRGVDYLVSRQDVDASRIAAAGNSGGGTQAAYLAVLEPRLAAIVSSCYMTSWEELWKGPGAQDAEQIMPGFLAKGLDFPDFALAAAPRPFLMTTAIRDFFPIAGARKTYDQIKGFYRTMDIEPKAGYFEFDDTHGWSKPRREAAYRWLAKWLQGREDSGEEGETRTEPEELLYATATGQVATGMKAETVQSLNAREAERLYAARKGPSPDTVRRLLRIETTASAAGTPVSLYLNSADDSPAPEGFQTIDVHKERGGPGYTGSYKLASSALLLGKTLPGLYVSSILSAVTGKARIYAKGHAAVYALYAAYLDPRIEAVALEQMPVSYLAIARAKFARNLMDVVVPGALKEFDLPDLAAAIAPRRVFLVDARHPNGTPMLTSEVRKIYPKSHTAPKPEGWTFAEVYKEFLQR